MHGCRQPIIALRGSFRVINTSWGLRAYLLKFKTIARAHRSRSVIFFSAVKNGKNLFFPQRLSFIHDKALLKLCPHKLGCLMRKSE